MDHRPRFLQQQQQHRVVVVVIVAVAVTVAVAVAVTVAVPPCDWLGGSWNEAVKCRSWPHKWPNAAQLQTAQRRSGESNEISMPSTEAAASKMLGMWAPRSLVSRGHLNEPYVHNHLRCGGVGPLAEGPADVLRIPATTCASCVPCGRRMRSATTKPAPSAQPSDRSSQRRCHSLHTDLASGELGGTSAQAYHSKALGPRAQR